MRTKMYWIVDEKTRTLVKSNNRRRKYYIIQLPNNTTRSLLSLDIKYINKDTGEINGDRFNVNEIELKTITEVSTDFINKEVIYSKNIEGKIPDPSLFPTFTGAVVRAIKSTKPMPLTKKLHFEKLSVLRVLDKISGTGKELSLTNVTKLLGFYNLTVKDILKSKYIK